MAKLQCIASDLFLTARRGIYPNMERNKKNTVHEAAELKLKKSRPDIADVKGGLIAVAADAPTQKIPAEINGPRGPEPTRYGDWEQKGRCTDF